VDGNAFMAWERLKNKCESSSSPVLAKMEKKEVLPMCFEENQDPEIIIKLSSMSCIICPLTTENGY
jgi:hypothetical protein